MRFAAFVLGLSLGAAAVTGCDRNRARGERFTVVDGGRGPIVESTPYDTMADRDRARGNEGSSTQTAGEVRVIGNARPSEDDGDGGARTGTATVTSAPAEKVPYVR